MVAVVVAVVAGLKVGLWVSLLGAYDCRRDGCEVGRVDD